MLCLNALPQVKERAQTALLQFGAEEGGDEEMRQLQEEVTAAAAAAAAAATRLRMAFRD